MNSKRFLFTALLAAASLSAAAQAPFARGTGRAPVRSEFISYFLRADAEAHNRGKALFFTPLTAKLKAASGAWTTTFDVTVAMLDRETMLHIEGAWPSFVLKVNGRTAGSGDDTRTPYEFDITPFLSDGQNELSIEIPASGKVSSLEAALPAGTPSPGEVYLYTQPKVRVGDITARGTATSATGRLNLEVALANSFNYTEKVQIGYDIYSPAGELIYYDKRDMEVPGNGCDTIRFNQEIREAGANLWSTAKPNLYKVMVILWREGRIVEYIPMNVGFSAGNFQANLAAVKAASAPGKNAVYNVTGNAAKTKTDLAALKAKGVVMVCPAYPQPFFFYDLCDQLGLMVTEQANVNCAGNTADRRAGGTPVNDPRLTDAVLERTAYAQARVKNHACVAAWSLGGKSGNGYNMYRSYLLLKSLDAVCPVVYADAGGEWNSDL